MTPSNPTGAPRAAGPFSRWRAKLRREREHQALQRLPDDLLRDIGLVRDTSFRPAFERMSGR